MDVPDWLLRWLYLKVIERCLSWFWDRYGESVREAYHVARYQLAKPFKSPPKTTATLMVEVVDVTQD
jgi:hypothetical protein